MVKKVISENRNRLLLDFFLQIDLMVFIVLLNNSNISNFILGHNDLKLDCLCYCYCCCLIFCISIFDYLCFSSALHFIFFFLVI